MGYSKAIRIIACLIRSMILRRRLPSLLNTEVALVLSGASDSCVCPTPAITHPKTEVTLVLAGSKDRCVCPASSVTIDSTTQSSLELNINTLLCQCPSPTLVNSTVQTGLVLKGDNTYCQCPTPTDSTYLDPTKYLLVQLNSGSKWCECPNTGVVPDPTQSTLVWNPTLSVCACPVSNNGGFSPSPVAVGGKVAYCQCPDIRIFDSATSSCKCPGNSNIAQDPSKI